MKEATDWRRVGDALHLRCFVCDCLTIGGDWNTRNVRDSYWRFYWNDRDGAGLETPSGDFALRGERGYFVPAGVAFHCRNATPLHHFYIHFDAVGFSGPVMRELFSAPLELPDDAGIAHSVRGLMQDRQRHAESFGEDFAALCRMKALLFAGLALHLGSLSTERLEKCGRLNAALRPVLPAAQRIEEDPARPHPIRELANACCMSETHFIRRFRELIGQTPTRYVQERRVTLAAQRLLFTQDSIERIAEETGFGNRFYFTRLFTRQTGVSPAAYRRARRI